MRAIFEAEDFEVEIAHEGKSGLAAIESRSPDVVACDLEMPGIGGLELLEQLGSQRLATLPVVMLTAHRDLKLAVRAMQLGAYHYLTKPIDTEEVVLVVKRALERQALHRQVIELRRHVERGPLVEQMGTSAQISDVLDQVSAVTASDFTVLVLGETGTGKELVAQAVHRGSERAKQPFIAVDCGAIPENLLESELFGHEKGAFSGADRKKAGQFQLAEGGTVFLDEIGNMPLSLQAKLLRALESRQILPVGATRATAMDVRFVAATNIDLDRKVLAGEFRPDLFFRLAQYTIRLPALRERRADIPHLANRFLSEAAIELRRVVTTFAREALARLVDHAWPGNVRELRNVVRQAVLRSSGAEIELHHVEQLLGRNTPAPVSMAHVAAAATARIEAHGERSLKEIAEQAAHEAERIAIQEALRTAGGNKTHAARALKTDFKTLHLKMKQLGIDVVR
jgi:DNA-binding NtrC family response regulator